MPRHHRIELAGAIHHVTAKAPSGRVLFRDDADQQRYLQLLAEEVRSRGWRVLTYCLLTNHLHILVQTPEPDLGPGVKRMHEEFARYINRRYGETGHVFGARYYSGYVTTARHVVGCLRYIARNPIEAGVCRNARDWPWSAHRALAGLAAPPTFLDLDAAYEHLGAGEHEARVSYVRLVARSDAALLADLSRPGSDAWLIHAIDDYAVPIADVCVFLRVSRATAYARVAKARRTEGSGP